MTPESQKVLARIKNRLSDIGVDYPEYYEERDRIITQLLEDNERMAGALELRKWHDDDCADRKEKFNANECCECGAESAKQALTAHAKAMKQLAGEG